jgi:hypothetical protein
MFVAWVETVDRPTAYSVDQLELAVSLAAALQRGRFLLLEPPEVRDEAS